MSLESNNNFKNSFLSRYEGKKVIEYLERQSQVADKQLTFNEITQLVKSPKIVNTPLNSDSLS
jgi:hypothetical protein